MRRAVAKANANLEKALAASCAAMAPGQNANGASSKSDVADLVRAIRSEEAKVHVDLESRIDEHTRRLFSVKCSH